MNKIIVEPLSKGHVGAYHFVEMLSASECINNIILENEDLGFCPL